MWVCEMRGTGAGCTGAYSYFLLLSVTKDEPVSVTGRVYVVPLIASHFRSLAHSLTCLVLLNS